ncbi:MAG: hypothetical protein JO010_09850 [Alphaproteobacteria bacterium]|nr:hypothetical protein [Alphaproteobacteria bacterium]
MQVMRVSVCNWLTTERDIEETLASVRDVLACPDSRLLPAAGVTRHQS